MKLKFIIPCAIAVIILSGCGTIEKKMVSNESLQKKASFAIGIQPSSISISNVQSAIDAVTFDAEANGVQYSCYYTTAIAVSSDAICRKMNQQSADQQIKGQEQKPCNELLKAAGRCD